MKRNSGKRVFEDRRIRKETEGETQLNSHTIELVLSATAILLAIFWLLLAISRPLQFDDAYMFYRYALHLREGLGVSWNPDGVPTYGLTSLLWVFCILPASLFPALPGVALVTASWCTGMIALAIMCFTIFREAKLRNPNVPAYIPPLAATLLLLNPNYSFHLIWGMDTELSLLVNAILVLAVFNYASSERKWLPYVIGGISFAVVLARPDNLICAFGAPLLMWFFSHQSRRKDLLGILFFPAALVLAELLLSRYYFGVALPLSLYAKALKNYDPYFSLNFLFLASTCAIPFLGALAISLRPSQIPFLSIFFAPAALTSLVLLGANQITGLNGRYYVPFIPFIIVPAIVMITESSKLGGAGRKTFLPHALIASLAMYFTLSLGIYIIENSASSSTDESSAPQVRLFVSATDPLPDKPWFQVIQTLGDDLIAHLPAGAKVAASEVGYIGAVAPQTEIIDMPGLNDTNIALHGFTTSYLFAKAPDLIWLPHTDYRSLRNLILKDSRLLDKYLVIAAFNYGLAIRRDSPLRKQIEADLIPIWQKLYGQKRLAEYIVTSVD